MTIRIIKLLSGYTFIMILNRYLLPCVAHPCKEENVNGILKANCSRKALTQNDLQSLNANIQYLDLSNATIDSLLTGSSLSKYKNLKWLSLRNASIAPGLKAVNSDPNVFKSLDNLEELDISGLKQIGFPKYNWPLNLRILRINCTGLKERLDASDLLHLEFLDVSDNEFMTKFPIFNPKAPIKTVYMYHANMMEDFTLKELASNCRIHILEMNFFHASPYLQPAHYCDCMQIAQWLINFHLSATTNLGCGLKEEIKCDTKLDESALEIFRTCVGSGNRDSQLTLLLCTLFIFALVAVTMAFASRYAKLRYHIKPIDISKSLDDEDEGEGEGDDEDGDEDEI